jgi:hypothetical protein
MNASDQTLVLWLSSVPYGVTRGDRGDEHRARPKIRMAALAAGEAT